MPIKISRGLDKRSVRSSKEATGPRSQKRGKKGRPPKVQTVADADVFFEAAPKELVGPGRGRPSGISDPNLHNRRDHLIQIFEACWGDIGWRLPKCKTPDEMIPILSGLLAGMSEDAVTAFNMISETRTTSSADLRELRRARSSLLSPTRAVQELLQRAEQRLGRARAAVGQATEEQRLLIEKELAKCEKEAQEAQGQYRELYALDGALSAELKFRGARFAREEILRFLRSKRYEHNPVNFANAAAGLPYIGWRQSMRRCSKEPSRVANSTRYQVFKAIRYLISNVPKKSEEVLINHFRNSIPNLPRRYLLPKADLAENWFFLERAVKSACQDKSHPKALIFDITRRYFSQQHLKSYTDIFLAEQARLKLSPP